MYLGLQTNKKQNKKHIFFTLFFRHTLAHNIVNIFRCKRGPIDILYVYSMWNNKIK